MAYNTPDLTAQNPDYKVTNDARLVISADQTKIPFRGDSVYFDSLLITLVGSINVPFVYKQDWTILPDDIDYDAMSSMKRLDSKFDKQLIKSITIIKPYVADYRLSLEYQKLYPVLVKYALSNSTTRIEITPPLIYELINDVGVLKQQITPVDDVHSVVSKNPMLLEVDPNKERPENFIEDELHEINVPGNISVIHPIAGDFFKDSVTVKQVETNVVLKKDQDYIIVGLSHPKTNYTTNESGVYSFILFLKPYVGNMKISYHAYGGIPTLYDMRAVNENVNNLIHYITDAQILTQGTLQSAPIIQNMLDEIKKMRDDMRKLATEGSPNYSDVSNGTCLVKKITSPDTEFHWWTIAELYKVAGSNTVFLSETGSFRIQTFYTKFMFDCKVAVDLTNPVTRMQVTVQSSLHPLYYVPYEDYSELDNIIRPQFRVIWNENTKEGSGMYLQIGMRLKTVATETIVVADVSGRDSCFKLIEGKSESVYPEDDLLTLPSKNHVWDKTNKDSRQETYLIPLILGNLVWAGSEVLNRPSGAKYVSLAHFLEDEVDISRIKQIRCDLEEEGANRFPITLNVIPGSDELKGVGSFPYNGKAASIICTVRRNPVTHVIEMSINAEIAAGAASNALYLKQVLIFT